MKIKVNLSEKSISSAIAKLQVVQKQLEKEMLDDFLMTCCSWIYDKANEYVRLSTIGDGVKNNIMAGWQPPTIETVTKNINGTSVNCRVATMRNTDDQAVYVEFGVGIVGKQNPHEKVEKGEVNYEYNIGSKISRVDNGLMKVNQWIFNVSNDSDIDIQAEYIDNRTTNTVKTKGSPAVMYAYNACVDLEIIGLRTIWQEIKKKYWG